MAKNNGKRLHIQEIVGNCGECFECVRRVADRAYTIGELFNVTRKIPIGLHKAEFCV